MSVQFKNKAIHLAKVFTIVGGMGGYAGTVQSSEAECDNLIQTGNASWYGRGDGFAGKTTANGETFNPAQMTAAHRSLPFNTIVRVAVAGTENYVDVRINDRGPFIGGRVIDLSHGAAAALGMVDRGVAPVEVYECQPE